MGREYDVRMGDKSVGKALAERQGLYYRISVRCDLDGDIMHKVLLRCGNGDENLGVLIPMGNQFGIDTRIPVKRAGEGPLEFLIFPRHGELSGRFVPLSPEEPFRYIAKLKDAFLAHSNNRLGIRLLGEIE